MKSICCVDVLGTKRWYQEIVINESVYGNLLHREDGPAREYADGYKEWFLNGKRRNSKYLQYFLRIMKPAFFIQ